MFLTILDNKLKFNNTQLYKIDTWSVKASQYNHIEDEYIKKSLSERWNDFEDGEKVTPDYYRRYYHNQLVEDLKLSNLNPHSFRHTAASKMKMAGMDDKAITDMIGHTSIDFTDKRYVEVDDNYLHEQMRKVK